jgi:hypothetical protein
MTGPPSRALDARLHHGEFTIRQLLSGAAASAAAAPTPCLLP